MQDDEQTKQFEKRISLFRLYLFSSFLGNLVAPIFSLFLPVLALQIGASVFEVGLVGGAENIVYAFMPLLMGHYTDRSKSRQLFIIAGFSLLACVSGLYSIASNPIALIFARLFEGVGWAIVWPAIESSITVETLGNSGRALSLFNSSWSLGASLGPFVGGVLIVFGSSRTVYQITALMLAAVVLVNVFFWLRKKTESSSIAQKGGAVRHTLLSAARQIFERHDSRKNFQVRLYVAGLILCYAGMGILYTFFGPYAQKILRMSPLLFSLPVVLFGVVRFLIYILSTRESVRSALLNPSRRNRTLFYALLIACASPLLMLINDPSGGIYFLAFGLFAFGLSIVYFLAQVGMIAESNLSHMGAGAGLFESVIGFGSASGPIIAGAIASGSYTIPFMVPIVGFALIMLIFGIDSKRKKLL